VVHRDTRRKLTGAARSRHRCRAPNSLDARHHDAEANDAADKNFDQRVKVGRHAVAPPNIGGNGCETAGTLEAPCGHHDKTSSFDNTSGLLLFAKGLLPVLSRTSGMHQAQFPLARSMFIMLILTFFATVSSDSVWPTCGSWGQVCYYKDSNGGNMCQNPTDVIGGRANVIPNTNEVLVPTVDNAPSKVSFSQTAYMVKWPIRPPKSTCVVMLETSELAPSTCPLPAYCGPAVWFKVSGKWYGSEVGLCIGTGSRPDFNTDGSIVTSKGLPDPHWARVTMATIDQEHDVCGVASQFFQITFLNGTTVYAAATSFANVVMWDPQRRDLIVPVPSVSTVFGGKPCPIAPHPQFMNFASLPMMMLMPDFEHAKVSRLHNVTLTSGHVVIGYQDGPHSTSGCSCMATGMLLDVVVNDKCLTHRFVTRYAIPGANILQDALIAVLDILFYVIQELFLFLWEAIVPAWQHIDVEYRLTETLVVAGMLSWKLGNLIQVVVGTVAYLLVVGPGRVPQ
jgi:hypothetical protein